MSLPDQTVSTGTDSGNLKQFPTGLREQRVKSFVESCCLLLERSLTRLAYDEIHFAGLSPTFDA